jgi:hypothetical protein
MPGEGASNGHLATCAFQRERARRRLCPARPQGTKSSSPLRAVRALDHDAQMAKHRVSALILDEHNLDEMARHGVSAP